MGCSMNGREEGKEETLIRDQEESLGFSKLKSAIVDKYFRKYSYEGAISLNQWRDIVFYLKLNTVNTHQYPSIEKFYQNFKVDGVMQSKLVHLLAVMLSRDKHSEKATLLFQIYDEHNTAVLDIETVKLMVKQMVNLSINQLPALAILRETQLIFYINLLQSVSSELTESVFKRFTFENTPGEIPKELSLTRFLSNIMLQKTCTLLEPSGLREHGLGIYRQLKN